MRSLRIDISTNGFYIKSLRQGNGIQQTHTQSSGQDMGLLQTNTGSVKTSILPVKRDMLAEAFTTTGKILPSITTQVAH